MFAVLSVDLLNPHADIFVEATENVLEIGITRKQFKSNVTL